MAQRRIIASWFSPTGGTRRSVLEIANELATPAEPLGYDLTVPGFFPETLFCGADDLLVAGVPVYRGRVPQTALDRFADWQGEQTPCVLVATYGNRHYDDALAQFTDFFASRGFVPIATAALVARHTYGEVQVDRPDAADLAADRQFASRVRVLLTAPFSPVEVPGQVPIGEEEGAKIHQPRFDHDACTLCGLCSAECSTESITQEDQCWLDPTTCIGCLRCLRLCPEDAIVMDDPEYLAFAAGITQRLAEPRANQYWP